MVDQSLLGCFEANELRADLVEQTEDRLADALAVVAGTFAVAVAEFHGLECAGRRATRHTGAAHAPVVEQDLDLDRGVAARVQDLASAKGLDGCHASCPRSGVWPLITDRARFDRIFGREESAPEPNRATGRLSGPAARVPRTIDSARTA